MGWLKGWQNRKKLQVTSDNSSSVDDYDVEFNYDTNSAITEGKMQSDGSDIRLTESDGSTLYPHYFVSDEMGNTDTTIYYNVNTLPTAGNTKTTYFYYNNPNASLTINASETCHFFSSQESPPWWPTSTKGTGDHYDESNTVWYTEGTKSRRLVVENWDGYTGNQIQSFKETGNMRKIILDHYLKCYVPANTWQINVWELTWPRPIDGWADRNTTDNTNVIWYQYKRWFRTDNAVTWSREIKNNEIALASAPTGTLGTTVDEDISSDGANAWVHHSFDNIRGFQFSPQGQKTIMGTEETYSVKGRTTEEWSTQAEFNQGTFTNMETASSDYLIFTGTSSGFIIGTWLSEWRVNPQEKKWGSAEIWGNLLSDASSGSDEINLEVRTTNDTSSTEHAREITFFSNDEWEKDVNVQGGSYVSCRLTFRRYNTTHAMTVSSVFLHSQKEVDVLVDEAPSSVAAHDEITFEGRVLEQATGDGIEIGKVALKRKSGNTVADIGSSTLDGTGRWSINYKPKTGGEVGTWTLTSHYTEAGI